ncbi:MAG: hypothetical protein HY791_07745 [Deltaproteobacteria bacterium]|nr:hypothetical protein [Deltaproteobacteria bacterium]
MRGILVCAALCAYAAPLLAKPYEDTRGRFTLDVAAGWRIEPRFGDTAGMVFVRDVELGDGKQKVSLSVEADGAVVDSTWDLADRIEAREGLGRRQREAPDQVGKLAGLMREYDRGSALVRVWYAVADRRPIVVRFEASTRAAPKAEREVARMIESLVVVGSKPEGPRLAGRFVSDGGVVLELGDDGSVSFGGREGRFKVNDELLTLELAGGKARQFRFELSGDRLSLSSPELPKPAVYRRRAADAEQAKPRSVAGRWRFKGPRGELFIELEYSGAFVLGPMKGQWELKGDELALLGPKGQKIRYRAVLKVDLLELAGGDLDKPLKLRRAD